MGRRPLRAPPSVQCLVERPDDRTAHPLARLLVGHVVREVGCRLSELTKRVLVDFETGFANSEEDYVDEFVGQHVQPFRIEDEARISGTNFIVFPRFKSHAMRDGVLITGQQQYSGAAAARLIIEALGV